MVKIHGTVWSLFLLLQKRYLSLSDPRKIIDSEEIISNFPVLICGDERPPFFSL